MQREITYGADLKPSRALVRIDALKTDIRSVFEWFGEIGLFCGRVFQAAITRPYEIRELIRQLDEVGSKSALLVLLAGAAMGVVLSLETRSSLIRFGAKSSLPAIIMISIVTESGPIITTRLSSICWKCCYGRPGAW